MERKKASDFPPEVLKLFDGYVHGGVSRREFFDRAAKYAADERVNAGWPAYEAALKATKVKYEMHMYANTRHGFHNDTTPRYDEAAAKLSWQRTLDFFRKNLKA